MKKRFDFVVQYSEEDVVRLVELQGKLLQRGFEHLKDDGTLIYATCTLNHKENEDVVRDLDSGFGIRILLEGTKGFYFAKIKRH